MNFSRETEEYCEISHQVSRFLGVDLKTEAFQRRGTSANHSTIKLIYGVIIRDPHNKTEINDENVNYN